MPDRTGCCCIRSNSTSLFRTAIMVAAAFVTCSAASVIADTTVVSPNVFQLVQGGGSANTAPLNSVSRYQQIFSATEFSAVTGPQYITELRFRPTNSQAAFSRSLSMDFRLSTTSTAVTALSSNFATNVGANDTLVRSGPITLSSASLPGPGSTKAFDIVIPLTTPFLYDRSAGNLLLDIRNFTGGFTAFVDGGTASAATRLCFVDGSTSAPVGTVQDGGITTQFTFSAVPSPSTAALLGLGGLMAARRRR